MAKAPAGFQARLTRVAMLVACTVTMGCSMATPGVGSEVSPYGLQTALANAKGGEVIRLGAADFGDLIITGRKYASPVRIDASKARFTNLIVRSVSGLAITGGMVLAPRETNFSVLIDNSSDIQLTHMAITGGRIGVTVIRSHDVTVNDNDFTGTRSDGVNVSMSQKVTIQRNQCVKFQPILPVYDPRGKLLTDGDHPDCVQIWSVPNHPVTSDLLITDNVADGLMQGVFITNPAQGADQPPFERVVVRNNHLRVAMFNGIVVAGVRGAIVRDNVVEPVPGAKMLNFPFGLVKPWVRITGENNLVCGNTVASWPLDPATKRCPKP